MLIGQNQKPKCPIIIMIEQRFSESTKIIRPCFLEDIDRWSQFKKKSLDGSQAIPGVGLFRVDFSVFLFIIHMQLALHLKC